MGKASWHEKLELVLRAETHALPITKGAGAGPQVNRDIENLTYHHPNQLGLRSIDLIMQPAQSPSVVTRFGCLARSPSQSLPQHRLRRLYDSKK